MPNARDERSQYESSPIAGSEAAGTTVVERGPAKRHPSRRRNASRLPRPCLIATETDDLETLARRNYKGTHLSLRWILVHMIEETGRHAGHADIIRELIDGSTGR